MKQVQIPQEVFLDICKLLLCNCWEEDRVERVKRALEGKLDALARRETYSTYKTAESPQEREKARQRYLDMVGMKESWRWGEDEQEQERKSGISP